LILLSLPQELTCAQANACLATLELGLKAHAGPEVVVDASPLSRFDSAALAVLLEFRRRCVASNKSLSLQGLPQRLADLAALYGILELLPIAPVK
jgi:phospholipid transport system transporter-binding protein